MFFSLLLWVRGTYYSNQARKVVAQEASQVNLSSSNHGIHPLRDFLVGGWSNPFEKIWSSNSIISPNIRGEHQKYLSFHHLVFGVWRLFGNLVQLQAMYCWRLSSVWQGLVDTFGFRKPPKLDKKKMVIEEFLSTKKISGWWFEKRYCIVKVDHFPE